MLKERNQLIRYIYADGMNKDLVSKKEEIQCNNMIKLW